MTDWCQKRPLYRLSVALIGSDWIRAMLVFGFSAAVPFATQNCGPQGWCGCDLEFQDGMVSQNTENEVSHDFRFWNDRHNGFGDGPTLGHGTCRSGFGLKLSNIEVSEAGLVDAEGEGLERRIHEALVPLPSLLKASRKATFRLWLDIAGGNAALGIGCLLAARPQVGAFEKLRQEQQAWTLQIHPEQELLRVIV